MFGVQADFGDDIVEELELVQDSGFRFAFKAYVVGLGCGPAW